MRSDRIGGIISSFGEHIAAPKAPNALGASPFWTDGDLEGPKTGARDKIGCAESAKWRFKG